MSQVTCYCGVLLAAFFSKAHEVVAAILQKCSASCDEAPLILDEVSMCVDKCSCTDGFDALAD